MRFLKNNLNLNFVSIMRPLLFVSGFLVFACIILIFTKGLIYGIDFKGGIEVQIRFNEPIDILEIRSALDNISEPKVIVQSFGDRAANEYLLKTEGDEEKLTEITQIINKTLKDSLENEFEVRRTDMVGARVGSELRENGFWAIIFSLIFILIYVAFRFDTKFAPGAVSALAHDILITIGIFILLGKEFNLAIIAALLTIVGYSLNDTIVVFDRIRENIKLKSNLDLSSIINISLNQTLSRTILTSMTTLFVLVSLMIFGGPILHDFAFAMCLGVLVGTYSSIFVASPMVMILDNYYMKKK